MSRKGSSTVLLKLLNGIIKCRFMMFSFEYVTKFYFWKKSIIYSCSLKQGEEIFRVIMTWNELDLGRDTEVISI